MAQRIVILGGGESGTGAAILARKQGLDVFLSDAYSIKPEYETILKELNIPYEAGMHSMEKILSAHEVVKSPGIPEKSIVIQEVRKHGIKVSSEIDFASRFTSAKLIAITGTNGKTTCTTLTYQILKNAGLNVALAGNIGKSFAMQVAQESYDYFVLEISSFQLDDIHTFKPFISVVLNITPDHLDRYNYNLKEYAVSKMKITACQDSSDYFIWCKEDPILDEYVEKYTIKAKKLGFSIDKLEGVSAWMDHETLVAEFKNEVFTMAFNEMQIKGRHNMYNSMAAALVGRVMDISKESIRESLADFTNIEHRMEKVLTVGGVEFINDSKATNVNSAWYALESVNQPLVWIVGGVDKGNDYSILVPLAEKKVKSIIALGQDVKKIHEAFGKKVTTILNAGSMSEAVKLSYHMASKGDVVLLSPACASFDLFENYEDRGRQFKKYVREL